MFRIFILSLCTLIGITTKAQETNEKIAKLSEQLSKVSKHHSKEMAEDIAKIREQLKNNEIDANEAEEMIRDVTNLSNRRLERSINRIMREMEDEIAKLYEVDLEEIENISIPPIPPIPPLPPSPPNAPPLPPTPPTLDDDQDRTTDLFEDEDEVVVEEDYDDDEEPIIHDDNEVNWKDDIKREWKKSIHHRKKNESEARHTSQFIFALGLNNLVNGTDLSTFDNPSIELKNSRFYEWGMSGKYRLMPKSAFLQFKYGLSLIYNNLRPSANKYYQHIDPASASPLSGQTVLADYESILTEEPYFRTTSLIVPLHVEFDFSKKNVHDEYSNIWSQKGVRLGIGGYAGVLTSVKQMLKTKNNQGQKIDVVIKGKWGTNNLVYGLSGYIGYKDMSFYVKYDLQALFKNNPIAQHNTSFGIRFDFN
jgi:hypothetical protein